MESLWLQGEPPKNISSTPGTRCLQTGIRTHYYYLYYLLVNDMMGQIAYKKRAHDTAAAVSVISFFSSRITKSSRTTTNSSECGLYGCFKIKQQRTNERTSGKQKVRPKNKQQDGTTNNSVKTINKYHTYRQQQQSYTYLYTSTTAETNTTLDYLLLQQ